jgi:hypothetical protein
MFIGMVERRRDRAISGATRQALRRSIGLGVRWSKAHCRISWKFGMKAAAVAALAG